MDVLEPGSLPKWGIWGVGRVKYETIMRACARKAFQASSSVCVNEGGSHKGALMCDCVSIF